MFCGDNEVGYFGEDVRLDGATLPIPISPKANVLVVQYSMKDNFSNPDFDKETFSLGISPVVAAESFFTIEIPTEGPIRIWGNASSPEQIVDFIRSSGFNLPSDTKSHQITAVFDFDSWILTLGLDNLDTTSVVLPEFFKGKEFEQLDLGLSRYPKGTTPLEAWNNGTGEYSNTVQKVYIGSPGGAACLKLNRRFREQGKNCAQFLKKFCMECEDAPACQELRKKNVDPNVIDELLEDTEEVVTGAGDDIKQELEKASSGGSKWLWFFFIVLILLVMYFLFRNTSQKKNKD